MSRWRRLKQRQVEERRTAHIRHLIEAQHAGRRAANPCVCDTDCPLCSLKCWGCHESTPNQHGCFEGHRWSD